MIVNLCIKGEIIEGDVEGQFFNFNMDLVIICIYCDVVFKRFLQEVNVYIIVDSSVSVFD